MKKLAYFWTVLLLLLFPLWSFGQLDTLIQTTRPAYLGISIGLHHSTFRDLATSPLFYVGRPLHIALSHIDSDFKRTSSFQLSYAFGDFESRPESEVTISKVKIISLNYQELFALNKSSHSKINLKIGGQLNSTANIRVNENLGNNSDGFEVISTLFASVQGTLDLTGRKKQLKKNLAIGLHVGLLNTAYRNSFIYTSQSPILNESGISDGYEFRFFSGYRLKSHIDYTFWLKNGNAVRMSYLWDLYRTGNSSQVFEMAAHMIQCTLLFNLK